MRFILHSQLDANCAPLQVANETLAPEIKPFVQKLYNLLADPQQYQDVILWKCVVRPLLEVLVLILVPCSHTGDAFFVAHNDRFINEVLQASFGHQNIHSFTRASSPVSHVALLTSRSLQAS